jgi:hypothetical protein
MARSIIGTGTRVRLAAAGAVAFLALGFAVSADAGAAVTDTCPAREIQRVWDGGTTSHPGCENLADQFDHMFYGGTMFTTRLAQVYKGDVVAIQLRLRDLNYAPLAIDGHYGTQTAGAVGRYQRNHGLIVDGKVGLQTWKALFGLGAG